MAILLSSSVDGKSEIAICPLTLNKSSSSKHHPTHQLQNSKLSTRLPSHVDSKLLNRRWLPSFFPLALALHSLDRIHLFGIYFSLIKLREIRNLGPWPQPSTLDLNKNRVIKLYLDLT
jgi:hypothetical protein